MLCHCFSRRVGIRELWIVCVLTFLVSTAMAQGYFPNVNSQTGNPQPNYLPPGSLPPEAYRLGIGAQNTDTGLQITDVTANSVARRAGLEAGDRIVTVAGQQVGYLGGKLIDLTPDHKVSVALYWHRWNVHSAMLQRLTETLVEQAPHYLQNP